jgi:penicillin G amidase
MWKRLNRAKNYNDYLDALQYFKYPSQNIVFASRDGDIAIKQEGDFPLRWPGQGNFIMPGTDSSYMWKGFIPRQDNPFVHNPEQGYISSANQRPVDSTYPYFIPGSYDMYRGISINRRLSVMTNITPDDMKKLQNDNYDVFAEQIRPSLLRYVQREKLSSQANKYVDLVAGWNLNRDIEEKAPTVFDHWVDTLSALVFNDELRRNGLPVIEPKDYILAQYLNRDSSAFKFADNINTPAVETLADEVTRALEMATEHLKILEDDDKLEWGKFKNTTIYHLLKTNMLPFAKEGLPIGGGQNIINASKHDHGPSWRMVVHMTTPVEAYGIYPGGQNGNPGSPFYDNMAMDWAKGQYYRLWIMKRNEKSDKRIKGSMKFGS